MKSAGVVNVLMNIIYVFAILGVVAFVAFGVIPASNEEMPIDFSLGVDAEYPVDDDVDILEMNIRDAISSQDGTGIVSVYEKGEPTSFIEINPEASDYDLEIDNAIAAIKARGDDKIVLLKNEGGDVLRQDMMYRDFDEVNIQMYTEISITNNLRYALTDVSVGIDMMNKDETVKYRILNSSSTTFATGESGTLPVELEINVLNASFMMISGGESIETYLGIEITGSYYFGLAGASIYATARIGTSDDMTPPTIDIEEDKITVTGDKIEDFLFPVPSELNATIGDVEIHMTNDGTGFLLTVEAGSGGSIVEALEEQYEAGDYTIDVDGTEIVLEKEQYAQMIDILKQMMEALA